MIRWTLKRVAALAAGQLSGPPDLVVTGVSTDSRHVVAGDLFVAIAGERFDGHQFSEAALLAGAAAVLVETGRAAIEPRVEVADTERALFDLAVGRRAELDLGVIAITGSTGKTSTKDMTAAAMGPGCWASPASFNNEIGVPLTVLATPEDASSLVVEVGSRGVGHIAALTPAVNPDVAVVTNLGLVHLETFGTTDDLAAAKGELIAALGADGVAVLPYGEERLRFSGREIRFGDNPAADVSISEVRLDGVGCAGFVLNAFGERVEVGLTMAGAHQALNAAAAVAAAVAAGRDLEAAVAGVESAVGSPWRMEVHPGKFIVVNDSYNANPTSMEAALRTTAQLSGRLVAVLGLMAELGNVSESEHRRIGGLARDLGFDPIIVVGEAPGLVEGAGSAALQVSDIEEARESVMDAMQPGCAVLIKGSRVVGLEVLARQLLEEAAA
ncbi:MAG: UDP-N-acetylmuramoyl-tripeptide--D-alanyl-D-alanine ligase [Acidimicrobiia bacterium]|nr:UDP-N-acetylmuramoyl-tripeptide--D-alanyl-D-alanine ligase [Acidimicrobiia bacterium]